MKLIPVDYTAFCLPGKPMPAMPLSSRGTSAKSSSGNLNQVTGPWQIRQLKLGFDFPQFSCTPQGGKYQ
jgi:hypothetical protein